jgi:hypothetical protein
MGSRLKICADCQYFDVKLPCSAPGNITPETSLVTGAVTISVNFYSYAAQRTDGWLMCRMSPASCGRHGRWFKKREEKEYISKSYEAEHEDAL